LTQEEEGGEEEKGQVVGEEVGLIGS